MKLKRITAFLLPGITLLEKTPADLSYIIRLAPYPTICNGQYVFIVH